jgi:hypothetical protein
MTRAVLILAFVAACGGERRGPTIDEPPLPEPPADAIAVETDGGTARVLIKVWPAKPTLGDSIWLRLDVEADAAVPVELPFDQQALGRFSVLRYAPEARRATYELAAPMSGRHRIPPLRVVAGGTEILTDEIPLEVASVLAEKLDRELAPPRGALGTYVGGGVAWSWIALAGLGVGAIAGVITFLMLRERRVRKSQVSAWELAIRRLAELEARGAPDAETADAWFVELSGVIRAYVEGRFWLRAPELTTEEFLAEARRLAALTGDHRELLGSFLERCDRVKFAGWRPEAGESLELLGVARSFVADTVPGEAAA